MSTPNPRVCTALVLVLMAILESAQGVSFSPQCEYRGYIPGGAINSVSRSRAVAPAKFETTILQEALDYFNKGSGVTAATLGMIDAIGDIMKAAPQMSAAIGIITVGLGFASSTPSPQDILDRSFESVKLLSEEVNVMMDQMQDYVDAKDLQIEKNIINNNYRELYDKWHGCVREVNVDRTIECQRHAVEALRIARYHFQVLTSEFEQTKYDPDSGRDVQSYTPDFRSRNSAGVWQYLQRECGSGKRQMQCLTHNQVRRLEVGIIKFRDFATLHIYALETLIATYKAQPLRGETCSYYKRYLSELIHAADYYYGYAEWAYKWAYIRQYEENEYYGIPARSTGRTIKKDSDFGGFMGTRKCSRNKCEMQCTQTIKDNTCTATGAGIETLKDQIKNKCQGYINDVKRQLMDFWTENILKTSEMWKKYGEDAKAKLKGAKCQE